MKALFLGAGASYDCGMPLVAELNVELRRGLARAKLARFNGVQRRGGEGWGDEIISKFLSRMQNRELSYENVIGSIEADYLRERDTVKREEIHGFLTFLRQAVHAMLLERQVRNRHFCLGALSSYEGLRTLAEESKPLWVFSLNHDVVLEMAAAKFSIPLKTGFHAAKPMRVSSGNGVFTEFSVGRLTRQCIEKNKYDFFAHGEHGINLVKLHGALDIFGYDDEVNYLKLMSSDANPDSYVKNIELLASLDLDLGRRSGVRAVNEHTYYDSDGELQFLRNSLLSGAHKFTRRVDQVAPSEFLSLFSGCLNYVNELLCMGYGFGDGHVDEKIADWLGFSSERKMTIINPGIDRCPSRFAHLYDQVSLCPQGAAEYFLKINPRPESMADRALRILRSQNRDRIKAELVKS